VIALVLGLAGIVVGSINTTRRDELWLEVAKAGVQLVAVVLIGGAVSAAWKYSEQARDARQEQRERQLAVFSQIVASYNEVKAIRRILRSLGLRDQTGSLDDRQVSGFSEQMLSLNMVQLAFEALGRELGETDLFDGDTAFIVAQLGTIAKFLGDVVTIWENTMTSICEHPPRSTVAAGLDRLIGDSNPDFHERVVVPRRLLTERIHKHLFGPATEETKRELAVLNAAEDTRPATA